MTFKTIKASNGKFMGFDNLGGREGESRLVAGTQ